MKKERVPNIEFEDAQIIFKNFSGEASAYTREGDRKFDLVIDPEIVDGLIADGWNVKKWQNENMEEPLYHLPVKVRFDNFPPKVYKLNLSICTSNTVNSSKTLNNTNRIPVNIVVYQIVTILQILTF